MLWINIGFIVIGILISLMKEKVTHAIKWHNAPKCMNSSCHYNRREDNKCLIAKNGCAGFKKGW